MPMRLAIDQGQYGREKFPFLTKWLANSGRELMIVSKTYLQEYSFYSYKAGRWTLELNKIRK